MSTRATVHFVSAKGAKPTAIIYRHCDGCPEGLGEDLKSFLADIKANVPDNRFDDPSYLAAKWVVTDAARMNRGGKHPCNFLSVGIMAEDPGDIEYRHTVICDGSSPPDVICEEV